MSDTEKNDASSPPSGDAENTAAPKTNPPRRSPYSLGAKIGRVIWSIIQATIWRWSPSACHGFRNMLLRQFGAEIGRSVAIEPSAQITIPWNLRIGTNTRVCEGAMLYCLGPVTIGEDCLIGPRAHICAGTHDYADPKFTLIRAPIEIGRNCIVLTRSFIGPNVTLADGCVVEPESVIFRNTRPDTVYAGNPAQPVGKRGEARE